METRWTVVVVDDHAPSRAAVGEAVTAQGGQVLANGSRAEDARRLVELHRPDVLVCAVGLSGSDGVAAAREVASLAVCPVVVVTSHTGTGIATRAIEAGVLGFLAKPLRAEELGPALDVAVSRFKELSTLRRENETLKRTLEGRKLIERAKGILMKRLGMSEPEAFRKIQKTAMDTRKPMIEIAQALLLSEELAHRTTD
jgi:response regulator NasT